MIRRKIKMARKHSDERLTRIYNDDCEFRAERATEGEDGAEQTVYRISGYPVVFDKKATINDWEGQFEETISSRALDNCDMKDVALFFNHDTNSHVPLARSKNGNGTLRLAVDKKGLRMETELDCERNSQAMELFSAIERGDISGMSFMFRVRKDKWSDLDTELPKREINDISIIHEVSIVNYPAYKDTSVSARAEGEGNHSPLEEARDAWRELELEKAKFAFFDKE